MFKLIKSSYENRTATFVLLVPDKEDRNWDTISEQEIIKTAHEFAENLHEKVVNINHKDWTDLTFDQAHFVETWIAPITITIWDVEIKKWSWLVAIKFDEEYFQMLVDWEFSGVSMEWEGYIERT